jgi:membrane protein
LPKRLRAQLEELLWHQRLQGAGRPLQSLVTALRYSYALLRDALTGNLTLHAMGLVYVTILSLVPLLAVSFSVLKAFGVHRQLQPLLYDFFEPLGERGAELTRQIIGFVDNVHGDVLAGLGLLVLFLTAVSLAEKVEGSFNYVWRVERPRSVARRFSEYLSVILLGPVVMVTAMALIARLSSSKLVKGIPALAPVGGGIVEQLVPYALVCLGFALVYWFVPNTRVRYGAALVGGLCAGTLWTVTGATFTMFVVTAASTISIYAGFAIVITALVWLYVSWLILLIGAQLAFYVQNPDYLRIGYRQPVTGTGYQEEAALGLMCVVARAFRNGGARTRLSDVAQATTLPTLALSPIAARLEAAGLLERAADDRLLPGRDPGTVRLREIVAAIREPTGADVAPEARWPEELHALSRKLEAALEGCLGDRTLEQLLDEVKETPGTTF